MNHLKKDINFYWLLHFYVVKMHGFHQLLQEGYEAKKDKNNCTRELAGRCEIISAGAQQTAIE